MIDTTQYPFIQLILGYAETGTDIYKWSKGSVAVLAAELHSLLTSNAVNANLAAEWEAKHHALRTQIAEMGREMASVVAERDALKAQQPKPPERKLREVRFGGYDDLYRWNDGRLEAKVGYPEHWAVQGRIRTEWLDEVNELRANPYEPVETVEEVLKEFLVWGYKQGMTDANTRAPWCTRLRAAFQHELAGGGQ